MKKVLVFLRHIFDSIQRIEEYTNEVEYEYFMNNNLIQAGVIREIEIIGEATKKLTQEFRNKYPDIPWKKMAGTRDKLIHDYFGVDIDAVWDTVVKDIPVLKKKMMDVIKKEERK